MSGGGRAGSLDRAHEVRAFLRARRTRWRPTAYQVYSTLLVGAIAGALAGHAVSSLIGGSLTAHKLVVFGPAVLILVLLAALRFGTWQGPVGFSTADVGFLLTAPIAIAALVRPKLDLGLWLGAAVGAVLAGVALLLMSGGAGDVGLARALGAVVGLAAFAAMGVAASWLVESSRRASTLVRRASPAVLLAAGILLAVSAASSGRSIAVWSGPWGWAIAPLAGTAGWPIAVLLICTAAAGVTVLARRRAGAAGAEVFLARAETRSGLTASAFTLDYRSAALTYRSALPARVARRTRLPRPVQPGRVVLWRDALAALREPSRLGWAMLLAAVASVEALTHPGQALPAAVAAVLLYFAASLLCEPLRTDVDAPDTSALLLSWPFARVLLAHCVLPVFVMFGLGAVTIVAVVLAGAAGAGTLILIPTVLAPVVVTAVLCAALAARSGGRVDENLLGRLLSLDASNPMGATVLVLWLIPWLIAAVVVVGGALLILGHAAAHHGSLIGAGVIALALTAGAAAVLVGVARESKRPDR
jgi:hypothetical protein